MSFKLMDKIFDLNLSPMEKLTMLTLGSYANDDGGSCFPSVTTLATKSGMTRRGTQKILRRLEDAGWVTLAGLRVGGARQYQIVLTGDANPVRRANVVRSEPSSQGVRTRFGGGANQSAQRCEPGSPDSVIDSVTDSSLTLCEASPTKGSASRGDSPSTTKRKKAKTAKQTDPRNSPTRELLAAAFREVCSNTEPPPWDGHSAKELRDWLASHSLGLLAIEELVRNVTKSERAAELLRDPARLIPRLRKYHVPLDRYGAVPTSRTNGRRASSAVGVAAPAPIRKVRVPLGLNRKAGERRWDGFLARMPERIGQHSYDTWLKPTRALGIGRNVLYVEVTTAENAPYLRKKYGGEFKEFLSDLTVEFRAPEDVSHG